MRSTYLLVLNLLLAPVFVPAQVSLVRSEEIVNPGTEPEEVLPVTSLPSNGNITGYHSEGKIRYSGMVKNKKLHGPWSSWYMSETPHDRGHLKWGIPDGTWRVWYANGQPRFVRNFSATKWQRVKQEFRNPHPRNILYPITRIYLSNGVQATELLKSSSLFSNTPAAEPYFPVFTEGLLHGTYINYFEDGSLRDSGEYVNGLRSGMWLECTSDESGFWQGPYHHGLRDGAWKLMARNGNVLRMVHYRKGEIVWEKNY